jgi:outer membrane murein-binding lipoprotein Lpp
MRHQLTPEQRDKGQHLALQARRTPERMFAQPDVLEAARRALANEIAAARREAATATIYRRWPDGI